MNFKPTENLLFFEQYGDINKNIGVIGMFRSTFFDAHRTWKQRPILFRFFFRQPKMPADVTLDVVFVAMIYFEKGIAKLPPSPFLMKNIAAIEGYGPTMYAAFMQLAKDEKAIGVLPTQDPTKILAKPKAIWQRFSGAEYVSKINLTATNNAIHAEPWLNQMYSVTVDQIIDLRGMRDRYSEYLKAIGLDDLLSTLEDMAKDLGKISVDAYKSSAPKHNGSSLVSTK